jgi:hypothetical protein
MPIPTSGYELTAKNIGGYGKVALYQSGNSTNRLAITPIMDAAGASSHLYLGGFRIGTGVVGRSRAIHAFHMPLTDPYLSVTVWEGVPVEIAETNSGRAFIYPSTAVLNNMPEVSEYEFIVGGGAVSLNIQRNIICQIKETPEDIAQAIVGNKHITIGRFGDTWAVALYPISFS